MQFERTDEYNQKLFEQALFDEKHILTDTLIVIVDNGSKLKAYCPATDTYLQFPRDLRAHGDKFIADIVEVIRAEGIQKYYRAMKGSIRRKGSNEVVG